MTEISTTPFDVRQALGVAPERLPRHVAIIMDGNGRWARQRGMPRIRGHEEGAKTVRNVVTHSARIGLRALTLYSFSTENWKRPADEVDFLMGLYVEYLIAERKTIMDNNIRFRHIGQRTGLPDGVLAEMDETVQLSSQNTGLTLCLALDYGAREEITDAVRTIARRVKRGELDPQDINQETLDRCLYTAGLPDPDLLVRTANERRLSNFLLWQISYAELFISDVLWPDFTAEHLNLALRDFAGRERRFGDVGSRCD